MLTPKQKRFCDEYLIDLNATQAAIRAGYSKRTANEQGARLLANASIQNYLSAKKQKLAEKSEITKERLIEELTKLALFDIRNIFTVDGGLKNVKDFGDDEAAAIAGIETADILEGFGDDKMNVGTLKKVKILNKINAIERISKMLGFDSPVKQELSGSLDFGTFLSKASVKAK